MGAKQSQVVSRLSYYPIRTFTKGVIYDPKFHEKVECVEYGGLSLGFGHMGYERTIREGGTERIQRSDQRPMFGNHGYESRGIGFTTKRGCNREEVRRCISFALTPKEVEVDLGNGNKKTKEILDYKSTLYFVDLNKALNSVELNYDKTSKTHYLLLDMTMDLDMDGNKKEPENYLVRFELIKLELRDKYEGYINQESINNHNSALDFIINELKRINRMPTGFKNTMIKSYDAAQGRDENEKRIEEEEEEIKRMKESNSQNGGFISNSDHKWKLKYLKYKSKYIQLRSQINP
jgi:hypothetical protein